MFSAKEKTRALLHTFERCWIDRIHNRIVNYRKILFNSWYSLGYRQDINANKDVIKHLIFQEKKYVTAYFAFHQKSAP